MRDQGDNKTEFIFEGLPEGKLRKEDSGVIRII